MTEPVALVNGVNDFRESWKEIFSDYAMTIEEDSRDLQEIREELRRLHAV